MPNRNIVVGKQGDERALPGTGDAHHSDDDVVLAK
jgi:hypothetical protein